VRSYPFIVNASLAGMCDAVKHRHPLANPDSLDVTEQQLNRVQFQWSATFWLPKPGYRRRQL